jgi:epoxide hydrolase 4
VIRVVTALAGAVILMGGAVPPILHQYADVNGVRLHYARTGQGPLIVFLHGFPEFWYEWKDQLAEFGRDHTAVAPDMRGYNLSSKPADLAAYLMPALVEDVRALASEELKTAGGARFTLVGHDWGGVVAWVFAAMHPDMVDKLVIINAPHPTVFARELRENAAQQKASAYMLMFRSPEAEAHLSADSYAALKGAVLGSGVTAEDTAAYVEAWSQPGALTGGLNYYRASRIGPPTPVADVADTPAPAGGDAHAAGPGAAATSPAAAAAPPLMVKVPTLVIWGEKDTALLTGNLTGLDEYVPELTVRRIRDATHWVVRERPAEVNRLIRAFLAGH